MRIAVVGGVGSTAVLVEKLAQHRFDETRVWGFEPGDPTIVSGWTDLRGLAARLGLGFQGFRKVKETVPSLTEFAPEIVFVVGLSQLVSPEFLGIAAVGTVGFHPTALPRGRGRAPVAWMALKAESGAANFFVMGEGVDDGPVLVSVPFEVHLDDDAASVTAKVLRAESVALDQWLPTLRARGLVGVAQDESAATWFGRRTPEDGCIDWARPANDVVRLVRASTRPHPGAFTFDGDVVVRIWTASQSGEPIEGVVGRVLAVESEGSFLVQAGDGPVRVDHWAAALDDWRPQVGRRLGLSGDVAIHELRSRCADLEEQLRALKALIARGL